MSESKKRSYFFLKKWRQSGAVKQPRQSRNVGALAHALAFSNDTYEEVEKKAPSGKFRVVGTDDFYHTDWLLDDCDNLKEASECAIRTHGRVYDRVCVYNDKGDIIIDKF